MSSIAVFLILGGATAFAAKKIGSNGIKGNSITTGKIKKEAVTSTKIKRNAVTAAKVKDGSLTGSDINMSTLGTVPSAASAQPALFAHVSGAGAIDLSNSKSAGSVAKVSPSLYCFTGLPFAPRGGQATVDYNDSGFEYAQIGIGRDVGEECPVGTQAFVFTASGSTPIAAGFYVTFYN
jgi:hypothetical protein